MRKMVAILGLMVATSAQAEINSPIYLTCTGEAVNPNRLHYKYFSHTIRVTDNTLAYWNADAHRFVDNCNLRGTLCETIVENARIKHTKVADGIDRKVITNILISRFTGSYMEMFDYVGPKTFENIITTSTGNCKKIDSPEQGGRAF